MFRKTIFKPPAGRNIGAELQRESGSCFHQFSTRFRQFITRYPRQIIAVMIATMLFSAVFAFTVMRERHPPKFMVKAVHKSQPEAGLGQVIRTAAALQVLWQTSRQIDTLLSKHRLSRADSLTLLHAYAAMDSFRQHLRNTPLERERP